MKARSPLLTPKWIAGHLLALALVVAFVNFGFWQLRRLEQARSRNEIIEARSATPPQGLGTVLPLGEDMEYLPVVVTGAYSPENEVLLRGRSTGGGPGFHVLTPLVLDASAGELAGKAVLVERGWVPYDMDQVPVTAALPPGGAVRVEGEVYPPQVPPTGPLAGMAARDPAEGVLTQSFYVDVARLQPQMPFELVPAYLKLRMQTPPTPGALPSALPPEQHDLGPHLGYAIQWFSFAIIGVAGYFFLLRSVLRPRSGLEPPSELKPRSTPPQAS
ncbi:MAG: SURF1 family protein [Trueperaceae bacterium]|jgi:surfeit locus 1 family protein